MLTLLTGALAGFVHVLAGPDHLAAVAPLASADASRAWRAGSTWGLGHSAGVVLVAAAAVLLRDLLPSIDLLSAWSERLVGGALIGIGLWALRRSLRVGRTAHAHAGTTVHAHVHVQAGPSWLRRLGHAHASFVMGILHGVAGSSHLFGVLPALALSSRAASLTYVTGFGAGSIVGMTVFAALLGEFARRSGHRAWAHRALMMAAAVLAIGIGGVWVLAPAH